MGIDSNIKRSERFAFLRQSAECPKPAYDQILHETDDYVVTPTLGSILPNWLLIVPKTPTLNFAEWSRSNARSPVQLVRDVLEHCSYDDSNAVWFEHGPAQTGTVVGCGVDQAHLHLIFDAPFSAADLQEQASLVGDLNWTGLAADLAYPTLDQAKSYYTIGTTENAAFVHDVERLGSQFLRRVIANLIGYKDAWDYRSHAHLANVLKTITAFRHNAN